MSVNRKIFGGVFSGLVFTTTQVFVALIQFRLILHFISRDLAGIWFLFLSIGGYIVLFDLGVSPTVGRDISFVLGRKELDIDGKRHAISDLIATCTRLFQILATTVLVVGLLLGGLYLRIVSSVESRHQVFIAWAIFALGASFNLLGGSSFAVLYGLGHVSAERFIRSGTQIVGLLAAIVALYLGFGLIGLSAAWAIQGVLARVVAYAVLYSKHPEFRLRGRPSLVIATSIAMPSLKWAATTLGGILILQTDNIILASVIGPAAIPAYQAAAKIATTLLALSMFIVTSSSPFLSSFYAADDHAAFNRLTFRNVRYAVGTMIILCSFVAAFGDKIIGLWLGPGNFVGFPVLWTLLLSLILEAHHVTLATATMATGRIIFAVPALLAGFLNLCFGFALARHFGVWGVALGIFFAQIATNNWYVPFASLRALKVSIRDYTSEVVAPLLMLTVPTLALNFLIRSALIIRGKLTALIIGCPVSFIIAISMFILIVMSSSERRLLREWVNQQHPRPATLR